MIKDIYSMYKDFVLFVKKYKSHSCIKWKKRVLGIASDI